MTRVRPSEPVDSPVIEPVLARHLAELVDMWELRCAWAGGRELTAADVSRIDRRIGSHVEAVLLHGDALLAAVQPLFEQDRLAALFVAIYLLLHLESDTARRVVEDAIRKVPPERLSAVREALCQGPLDGLAPFLQELARAMPATAVSLMAAEVLAVHHQLDPRANAWRGALESPEAPLRVAAWRIVAQMA